MTTIEVDSISIPAIFSDPDASGAQSVSFSDLVFAGMSRMDDAALESVVTAMRQQIWAQYKLLAQWVRVIRVRRALSRKSERAAAKETGVSRAAVRKATTAAKRK